MDGSARAVYAALAGNVAIAAAKFAAFGLSGSSAMLTEAIHSLVAFREFKRVVRGRDETRSLIAGDAVAPPVMADIKRLLGADPRIERVVNVATLHLGPKSVLVALTLSFTSEMTLTDLRHAIRDLTIALKKSDARIGYVYVRPAPDVDGGS